MYYMHTCTFDKQLVHIYTDNMYLFERKTKNQNGVKFKLQYKMSK